MTKTDSQKHLLLEQLKKTPIVQVACEKTDVSRATYYRWRDEDEEFSRTADAALAEGGLLVNDLAESKLVSAIKDKSMQAIFFWLKHHHPTYGTKVELSGKLKHEFTTLSDEQKEIIKRALQLSTLRGEDENVPGSEPIQES